MQGQGKEQYRAFMPIWVGMLCALVVLDGYSSVHFARGKHELNPLITALATNLGFSLAISLIKFLDLIIILVFYRLWERHHKASIWTVVLAVINLSYALVIINNFS